MKLNLGCGSKILPGYVNVDLVNLPGVNLVTDLSQFPWPFKDSEAKEIVMTHVLEHFPNTIQIMEEVWRISAPLCKVLIHVPYWNASDYVTDPTHIRPFNERTMNFFDPRFPQCKERWYYSRARFSIKKKVYSVKILGRYFSATSKLVEFLANYLCNIIQTISFELEVLK